MAGRRATRRMAAFAAFLLTTVSCGGEVPSPSGGGPQPSGPSSQPGSSSSPGALGWGEDFFSAPAIPLDLSVSADRARAATLHLTAAGGSVTATAANGTTFTLEVPADAVLTDVDITLVPATTIDGWPEAPGNAEAVLMEPEGLTFASPARLLIAPSSPVGDSVGSGFGFYAEGHDTHLELTEQGTGSISLLIDHFSGHGFVWNVAESFWLTLERYRQNEAEDRVQHRLSEEIARYREQEKRGERPYPSLEDIMAEARTLVEREVINRRLLKASASCKDAKSAMSAFFAWNRHVQLLGLPDEYRIEPPPRLRDLVRYVCAEEATQSCLETGDVERLASKLLMDAHSLAILGEDTQGLTARYLEACARFDLEIQHHSKATIGGGGMKWEMVAEIEVTVPLRWNSSGHESGLIGKLEGEALGKITSATGVAGPCSLKINPGAGDAPYEVKVDRVMFINTGPEADTVRLMDVQATLKEGHFSASGSVTCPRAPAAPFPGLDIPFVFWDNPATAITGWEPDGHPTVATKTFERTLSLGTVGTEKLELKLIHTPGPMPPRPEIPVS
jgi:hypothetical protein